MELALSGHCIVYPTSTQPALGCIPNPLALDELFTIKNRPSHVPVSLGVVDLDQAGELVEVPEDVPAILAAFPEGSLTIVLRAHETMDSRLGGANVAIRVVSHPIAKEFLRKTGPLTATSANPSGEAPLYDCDSAARLLSTSKRPVGIIAGMCGGGAPSTLIAWHTVCGAPESLSIEVVREGKVSSGDVLEWWKRRI
ncbi:MAG: L-threonylcarbamoyladenylate synthase [Candidatus Thalassarchaeaceae archaeon]|nr:L-threonylcarbamoyladenylate synthase [Candidatus Thalassarchaeaceae archaeon]MDP6703316.1 L-threonylcarbamoyladenylate synthase [Candidatus Thalassarchaeaceae archaeon]